MKLYRNFFYGRFCNFEIEFYGSNLNRFELHLIVDGHDFNPGHVNLCFRKYYPMLLNASVEFAHVRDRFVSSMTSALDYKPDYSDDLPF